jgi:hypothetical protein
MTGEAEGVPFSTAITRLNHPDVAKYYLGNGHRIAAFRSLLGLLDLPLPDWALRMPSGAAANRVTTMNTYKDETP